MGVLELLIDSWAYRGTKRFADGERAGLIERRVGEFIEALEKAGEGNGSARSEFRITS
jgi:hypothetical protein